MANAQVSQSAIEIIALANPYARVSQSAIEIITIPAVLGVHVILRGVKRYPISTPSQEPVEVPEPPHVENAV